MPDPPQPESDTTQRVVAPVAPTAPGAPEDLPLPEDLTAMLPHGNYVVAGFLGQGGMGAVYKGTQVRLQRDVAIKIMRRDQGKDHDFESRFHREALAMARLNHPNIVNVIDYGEAGPDYLYIVMELVDGADLMEVIRAGQMTQDMALTLLPQICDALQFAHDHGIVHRDIKPSNVMLTRDGRVKMADFGLAKRFDVESSFHTQAGTGMGTPDYAAPEQFSTGVVVDHRADIYALGVMIYQMITGHLPRGAWKPPSQRAPVDPQWDNIVSHAMQSDPQDRYATVSEVKTEMSRITPLRTSPPLPPALAKNEADKRVGAPRRSKTAMFLGIVGSAAVVGIGAFFVLKQPESDSRPTTAPAAVASSSPGASQTFAGHRYQFIAGTIDWDQAKAKAAAMGGHLATVTSKEEMAWIHQAFASHLAVSTPKIWLGGSTAAADQPWQWVTGEPFKFTDWAEGEPNYTTAAGPIAGPYAAAITRNPGGLRWTESPKDSGRATGFIVEWDEMRDIAYLPLDKPAPVSVKAAPIVPVMARVTTATKESPFVNSLGMKFVPVPITGGPTNGQRVLFSVWETRVQDYDAFAKETKREWPGPGIPQMPTHPAVAVSWDDTQAFCVWLTERERKLGNLGANERYRLPSDHEWSCAVGIGEREDPAKKPGEKSFKLSDVYPWGSGWPPPAGAGNYAGEEQQPAVAAGKKDYLKAWGGPIAGYRDDHVEMAPVGSFAPDRFGLHDLSGNAWEWCEDWHDHSQKERLLRGASWWDPSRVNLLSSMRWAYTPAARTSPCGFRVVVAGPTPDPAAAAAVPVPQGGRPPAAPKDARFTNTLGMKFVPVPIVGGPTDGKRVLFSVWETRVQDYDLFAKETKREWLRQGADRPTNPAGYLSWDDAQAFCAWLTDRERKAGKIDAAQGYRLPSDHEWSCAVGIGDREDAGKTPVEKRQLLQNMFPWGSQWPPVTGAGNLAGEELLAQINSVKFSWIKGTITGYRDDHLEASPVDSYLVNQFGLLGLAGNVQEWCEDWYSGEQQQRVLRGASWDVSDRSYLRSAARGHNPPESRFGGYGFRCVLADSASASLTKDAPFTNSLGMQFVPVPIIGGPTDGQRVLFSVWETRVQDYETFAKEAVSEWASTGSTQTPAHPAENVSWDDAQAYCEWLTERERKAGKLSAQEHYRLPTDHEWSCAMGIGEREDAAKLPAEKDQRLPDVFPWGSDWPPPANAGNYAGEELQPGVDAGKYNYLKEKGLVAGYHDGHVELAPVASFAPNSLGLHDLSGNIWEWCEDWYDATQKGRVLRGASWWDSERGLLLASDRAHWTPEARRRYYGFRVVIAPAPAAVAGVTKDASLTNTLGMKLVPVPDTQILMCIHETRKQDYAAYAEANPGVSD
ncbi:MAG: SUMF1/EgtB/PvdO family nonheme iron enzyme, partial [Prosthecobacter sp.]|nr:SUMF1/EgtB/PvdO family nonheme iron enzyme [Prosthecobacter sp.]